MEQFKVIREDIRVLGKDVVDLVGRLLHEGNVRRVIIRDTQGHTFMEVPVVVAAVGAIVAPVLAAIGALAALVADFHLVVERVEPQAPAASPSTTPPAEPPVGPASGN
jgi:phage-related minor tail protein